LLEASGSFDRWSPSVATGGRNAGPLEVSASQDGGRTPDAFVLRAEAQLDVKAGLSSAFTTWASREIREFEPAEFGKVAKRVRYTLHPANGRSGYKWGIKDGMTVGPRRGRGGVV
jgi:hypothetical protein